MGLAWTIWLLLIVASFAMFETYALVNDRMTLSRWVWTVSKAFPPFGWIVGIIVGFLGCHFFWGGVTCFTPA